MIEDGAKPLCLNDQPRIERQSQRSEILPVKLELCCRYIRACTYTATLLLPVPARMVSLLCYLYPSLPLASSDSHRSLGPASTELRRGCLPVSFAVSPTNHHGPPSNLGSRHCGVVSGGEEGVPSLLPNHGRFFLDPMSQSASQSFPSEPGSSHNKLEPSNLSGISEKKKKRHR